MRQSIKMVKRRITCSYDETSSPAPKGKIDVKFCSEVEEILGLLHRLFLDFPEEKIIEIKHSDCYDVVSNMLRRGTADKFRNWGFQLLLSYISLMKKAKYEIPPV